MKIGIIGKGGSGKSSVSWMLMQAALQQGFDVWGLDADYNQHLARMFGVNNENIMPLADHRPELTQHVIGSRQDVTLDKFDKATLPSAQSRLIELSEADPMLGKFVVSPGKSLHLLRVGNFDEADKGMRCYHSRTAVADILLSHLAPLKENQMLVVDFTAGVDPFASPIYLKLDVFVLVVEPTLKGVEVARQWQSLLADTPVPLLIIANKLTDQEDSAWLAVALQPQALAVKLQQEPAMKKGERGQSIGWNDLLPQNRAALTDLIAGLKNSASSADTAARDAMLNELQRKRA